MYLDGMHQEIAQPQAAILVTTTGVKARIIPGYHPKVLKAAAFVIEVVPTVTATVIAVKMRPTIGSATGEVTVDTITVPTSRAIGDVLFVDALDQKVVPGGEIVFDVTTASTAGSGHFVAFFEPWVDNPENNTDMFESV